MTSPPGSADLRPSPRELATAVVVGLVLAVLAAIVTAVLASGSGATYTATAQLAQIPQRTLTAGDVPGSWDTLGGGGAGKAAASVLQAPRWRDAAAKATGFTPSAITVTATLLDNTSLIAMTAEAPTAQAAEKTLDTVIADATPTAQTVSGPYDIIVVQPATNTARATGVPTAQLAAGAAVVGLVVGTGVTMAAQGRRRERSAAELAYRR